MRLLLTSDWHGDWVTAGFRRFEDVARAVDRIVQAACSSRVDAVVFLGDLANPGRESAHRAVAMAVAASVALDERAIDSVWMTGNHDVVEDGTGAHVLLALGQLGRSRVRLVDRPARLLLLGRTGDACDLFALPYTPRSHTYDPERELERLFFETDRSYPQLVVAHLNIEGIQPGSETTDMARGRDVFFPLEAARRLMPDAVLANGHYHRRQVFDGIHIPGSPERLAFGEEDNDPGFLVVEL